MSNNDYKKLSNVELGTSDLVARYPSGTININDIYGTSFINKNTTINNNKDIVKNTISGKCVKNISSRFPEQKYNIQNPDGSKTFEYFTNNFVKKSKHNYNFYLYVLSFVLILLLIFLNKIS